MDKLFENWKKYLKEAEKFRPSRHGSVLPDEVRENIGSFYAGGAFGVVHAYEEDKIIKLEIISNPARKQGLLDKYLSILGHFSDSEYPNVAKVLDYGVEGIPEGVKDPLFPPEEIQPAALVYIIMERFKPLQVTSPNTLKALRAYDFRDLPADFLEEAVLLSVELKLVRKMGRLAMDLEEEEWMRLVPPLFRSRVRYALEYEERIDRLLTLSYEERKRVAEFAKFLVSARKKGFLHFDLHKGNIMSDKKGSLVIIDHGGFMKELGLEWRERGVYTGTIK